MFAKILKDVGDTPGLSGWAAYWAKKPHGNAKAQDSLHQIHSEYIKQAAKDIGHPPISDNSISKRGNTTAITTNHGYRLGQRVIDHLASQGFERKNMARNGMDSVYTMEHPKTKAKVKVGYFQSFGKALTGTGANPRVEITHVPNTVS